MADGVAEVQKQLNHHGKKLDEIRDTLQHMAVQDEQIKQIQREQVKMWEKIDDLCGQGGTISRIERHQASCPRKQIQIMWYVVIPMGLTQLAMAAKLLSIAGL
jgi:hypothetical protein